MEHFVITEQDITKLVNRHNLKNMFKKYLLEELTTASGIKTIFIDIKYIRSFIDNILPNNDFVEGGVELVISDHATQSTDASNLNYKNFLDDKKIKKVYAEDWFDVPHPKLRMIPIGFESKPMIRNNGILFMNLIEISHKMPEPIDKPLKILSNAQLKIHEKPISGSYNQRKEMVDALSGNVLVDFWSEFVERTRTWERHTDYSFELCPEGNGIDTHRWCESLLLNTIPIVKRNFLEPMHQKLPIVIVDSWDEITEENCLTWRRELSDRVVKEKHKLLIDYWIKN